MDKTLKKRLTETSEDLFFHSQFCERDSMEHDLVFIASQLVDMAIELVAEKEDA